MDDGLNKQYVAEESKPMPEKTTDIAIKGTTLMVIENGKVVDYDALRERYASLDINTFMEFVSNDC